MKKKYPKVKNLQEQLKDFRKALESNKRFGQEKFLSFAKKCKSRKLVRQKLCTCPPGLYCDCREYGDWHKCIHERHPYHHTSISACSLELCPRLK